MNERTNEIKKLFQFEQTLKPESWSKWEIIWLELFFFLFILCSPHLWRKQWKTPDHLSTWIKSATYICQAGLEAFFFTMLNLKNSCKFMYLSALLSHSDFEWSNDNDNYASFNSFTEVITRLNHSESPNLFIYLFFHRISLLCMIHWWWTKQRNCVSA